MPVTSVKINICGFGRKAVCLKRNMTFSGRQVSTFRGVWGCLWEELAILIIRLKQCQKSF